MKRKNMVVIGMVVGCLMMVAGAAWAGEVKPGTYNGTLKVGNLVWMLNPNSCLGSMNWDTAVSRAKSLASGQCGLFDGSKAGDWRLPTKDELVSIYVSKSQFSNIQTKNWYWSSTTEAGYTGYAWVFVLDGGSIFSDNKTYRNYVWPVRGGQ